MALKKVDYDQQFLRIQIVASGREFGDLVAFIKSLTGWQFLSAHRLWLASPTKDNLHRLEKKGFELSFSALGILAQQEAKPYEPGPLYLTKEQLAVLDGLRHYQLEGVQFLEQNNGTGLVADEMGLGKTIQAAGYVAINKTKEPVLIICKATGKINWQREVLKWTGRKSTILEGMTPITHSPDKIFILNYDILGRETAESKQQRKVIKDQKKNGMSPHLVKAFKPEFEGWFKTFLEKIKPAVVITDEVQMVSNMDQNGEPVARTQCFVKLIKGLQQNVPGFAFIPMSGTPFKKKPAKFFTVLNLLDPKKFPSRWAFYHRYCGPKHNGFSWTFDGASNIEELHAKIKPLMIRRKKREVLKELPPNQPIVYPLPVDPKKYAEYLHAENDYTDFVKGVDNGKGPSKAGRYFALKQLSYWAKRDALIQWIRDFIEDKGKLVVFAKHHAVLDDIQQAFKNCVRVDGNVTGAKRQAAIDAFQNDAKVELFLGQVIAAGDTITLTAASAVAFAEMPDSGEDIDQCSSRVDRFGQTADEVFTYFPIAPNTLEEDCMPGLLEAYENSGRIMDGKTPAKLFGDYSETVERWADICRKRGKRKV